MEQEQLWILIARKLSGEATEDELQELEIQLHLHPDIHYALQPIYDLWHLQANNQDGPAEDAYEKHLERMRSLGVAPELIADPETTPFMDSPGKRRTAIWLGSILIFTLITFTLLNHKSVQSKTTPSRESKSSEIITKNGSKTKFLLRDGTSVWLNAGSKLTYDSTYGNSTREVSLNGEAFFDVVKNASHPFIIHTGKLSIKVLGTAFNVKSYDGDRTIETSLIRGSVEISFNDHSARTIVLKPNQKLVVTNDETPAPAQTQKFPVALKPTLAVDHINRSGKDSIVVETAWMENRLIFDDESFTDLAKKMERWYGVQIDFEDSKADSLHFTGSFSRENIEQALNALRFSAEFKYSIQNNHVRITAN